MDKGCPRNSLEGRCPSPAQGRSLQGASEEDGAYFHSRKHGGREGSVVGQGRASGGTPVTVGRLTQGPWGNSPAQEKDQLCSPHWAPPPLAAGGSREMRAGVRTKT